MKKTILAITLLVIMACTTLLCACGSVKGEYKFVSLSYYGVEVVVTYEKGERYGIDKLDENSISLEIKDNNTYVMKVFGELISGKYDEEDGILYFDDCFFGKSDIGGLYLFLGDDYVVKLKK